MSDLTEFLLARFAEDEAVARASFPTGGRRAGKTFWRRRIAECEVKRRIVDESLVWGSGCANVMIGLMAEVYSDHPDYRDEWRL